ncbi:PIG-L deacetylase family protein [Nocardioides jiangxiensis]|uniref:PIG-L family deacetylase n=1 Tax=Nocardioides jiangxiensis TaxID=3064524 RepID=A0ABT9B5B2_9ACTN|nr:PIG-L family deacetylase [Nocardioides sp. WY-20]MDO7869428.1 PIG-L family deacetylase [Nocardioides sp. WY-20]
MATIVSLHAHPDDEALLTGGWLAQRARGGDRVVLVFATDGEAGLSDHHGPLGVLRRAEGEASARALGAARVVWMGHADSGMADAPTTVAGRFVDVPVSVAARTVADVLDVEDADILTGYDANGGYGHPDHVAVHRVARAAQEIARRRPLLLEATRDRTGLVRLLRVVRPLASLLPGLTLPRDDIYADPAEVVRVDVRDAVEAKRAALAAHASQATGGVRTVRILLALPGPLARRVLGREWFVEVP